jgi:hypothetical protein
MQVASNQAPQMLHFELLQLNIAALGPCGATLHAGRGWGSALHFRVGRE